MFKVNYNSQNIGKAKYIFIHIAICINTYTYIHKERDLHTQYETLITK